MAEKLRCWISSCLPVSQMQFAAKQTGSLTSIMTVNDSGIYITPHISTQLSFLPAMCLVDLGRQLLDSERHPVTSISFGAAFGDEV